MREESNPRLHEKAVEPARIPCDCHAYTHYKELWESGKNIYLKWLYILRL